MPGVYSQALPGLVSLERRVGGAIGSYFIDGVAGGALLVVSQMPRRSHDMWPGPSQRMLLGLTQASVGRALGACVVEGCWKRRSPCRLHIASTNGPANAWDLGTPQAQNLSEVMTSAGHAAAGHLVAGVLWRCSTHEDADSRNAGLPQEPERGSRAWDVNSTGS